METIKHYKAGIHSVCYDNLYEILFNDAGVIKQVRNCCGDAIFPSNFHLQIPSEIEGIKICEIENEFVATSMRKLINTVTIPDDVKIDSEAFFDCSKMTIVNWNNTKIIPNGCFCKCQELRTINGIENVVKIEESAFSGCVSLKKINISDDVEYIGPRAFFGCFSLTSFNWPSKCQKISPETFCRCTNLKAVKNLNNVGSIGIKAFAGTSIENFTIPKNCHYVMERAFAGCAVLKKVDTEESLTPLYIGPNAFLRTKESYIDIMDLSNRPFVFMSKDNLIVAKEIKLPFYN